MIQPNAEKSNNNNSWQGAIKSISADGIGVGMLEVYEKGRTFTRPIFIPFTAPQDVVVATIDCQEGKYLHGKIKKIITPSPHRIVPTCPHFTTCGGCNLQHIKYDEQLNQKAQQIQFLLERRNIILPKKIEVLPAITQQHYRMRSKIAVSIGERIVAGYRRYHTRDIIPITHCDIVSHEILECIRILNATPHRSAERADFEVLVAVGSNGKLGMFIDLDEVPSSIRVVIRELFDLIYGKNRELIGNLLYKKDGIIKTSGQVQEHLAYTTHDLQFSFTPDIFIQANVQTNNILVDKVIEFVKREPEISTIIDLYAGMGNFSLPLAKHARHIIGVEGNGRSCDLAKINILQNKIENITFINLPIEQYLPAMKKHVKGSTHIIIDPPRTGCTNQVIAALEESEVENIIYISCDPTTLATDLQKLTKTYNIEDIVGVDMFPNISHVETIVLLKKISHEYHKHSEYDSEDVDNDADDENFEDE